MVYYQLLYKSVKENALVKRITSHSQSNDKIAQAYDTIKSFVIKHAGKLIVQMLADSAGFIFVTEKGISESKCAKMLNTLTVN